MSRAIWARLTELGARVIAYVPCCIPGHLDHALDVHDLPEESALEHELDVIRGAAIELE